MRREGKMRQNYFVKYIKKFYHVDRGLNKLSDGRVNPTYSTGKVMLVLFGVRHAWWSIRWWKSDIGACSCRPLAKSKGVPSWGEWRNEGMNEARSPLSIIYILLKRTMHVETMVVLYRWWVKALVWAGWEVYVLIMVTGCIGEYS